MKDYLIAYGVVWAVITGFLFVLYGKSEYQQTRDMGIGRLKAGAIVTMTLALTSGVGVVVVGTLLHVGLVLTT